MRKSRPGEIVCRCAAYEFPHRLTGGECTGRLIAEDYFFGSDCRDCLYLDNSNDNRSCQVLDGAERVTECPVWRETMSKNEVRLYGLKFTRCRDPAYRLT